MSTWSRRLASNNPGMLITEFLESCIDESCDSKPSEPACIVVKKDPKEVNHSGDFGSFKFMFEHLFQPDQYQWLNSSAMKAYRQDKKLSPQQIENDVQIEKQLINKMIKWYNH
jgi:hypothetical protein